MSHGAITPLGTRGELAKLHTLVKRVLKHADPYGEPFNKSAPRRALLFPQSYRFDEVTIDALTLAARRVGDSGFFFSYTEPASREGVHEPREYWVPLVKAKAYPAVVTVPFENLLVSEHGSWAVVFAQDDFALVGGEDSFVDGFLSRLETPAEHQLHSFLRTWNENNSHAYRTDWILRLLAHLYGRKRAEELLSAHAPRLGGGGGGTPRL